MTINGGQPHKVDYSGQSHVICVRERGKEGWTRIGWLNPKHDDAVVELLRSLNLRDGWTDATVFPVVDHEGNPDYGDKA